MSKFQYNSGHKIILKDHFSKMNTPKVSILLPTYNHANYLGESIQSALTQSFTDFELIIVNDDSPDDTETVIKRFADPRIKYIFQENKGVPGALNTAFSASCGEYIAILNDDDRWLPEKLAQQTTILNEKPDVGVVYGIAQVIDAQGEKRQQTSGFPARFPEDMLKSLLLENGICPVTVLIRRSCLEETGPWDENLPGVDDRDMWLRLAKHCNFVFQDEIVAEYRLHATNYSAGRLAHFVTYQNRRIQVLDKFFNDPCCPPRIRDFQAESYYNAHLTVGLQYIGNRYRKEGFRHLLKAFKAAPSFYSAVKIPVKLILQGTSRLSIGRSLLLSYKNWRLRQRMPGS